MINVTVKDKTPELMQKLQAATGRFVRKGALYIEGRLKASMAEPKSGAEYSRGKDSVHVASAAGESPAVDSSNYTNSIQSEFFSASLDALIGTPVEYAPYLEDGTENIEPRPLWEKEATDSLPTLENLLQAEVRRAR